MLFVFKEMMVKCDKKKQVYGINPPAFSCCLVFLGALPAASASFFFWLFDFGGMIFLFFSKILKLARKVALQNDNAAVTWPELSLKIQLKVIITMVATGVSILYSKTRNRKLYIL